MVNGKLCELINYIPYDERSFVKKFIETLTPNIREGKYMINGENIYALIMSYPTKIKDECLIEAHDIYVDVQFTLVGEEGISIFNRSELKIRKSMPENDFYDYGTMGDAYINIENRVGYFTMIETDEAHRPQESVNGKCELVKKGVIKIKKELFLK